MTERIDVLLLRYPELAATGSRFSGGGLTSWFRAGGSAFAPLRNKPSAASTRGGAACFNWRNAWGDCRPDPRCGSTFAGRRRPQRYHAGTLEVVTGFGIGRNGLCLFGRTGRSAVQT